jgi:hypothetical protein
MHRFLQLLVRGKHLKPFVDTVATQLSFHTALTSFCAFWRLVHLQPIKMDHSSLLFFGSNEKRSFYVYGMKLKTENHY